MHVQKYLGIGCEMVQRAKVPASRPDGMGTVWNCLLQAVL